MNLNVLGQTGYSRIELKLGIQGRSIMVLNCKTMAYGGLIEPRYSEALVHLSERFKLTLDAYLVLNKKSKGASHYILCIVLQGHREDADEIGSLLNDAKIYLQTPRAFYKPLQHFNPHYLYRPVDIHGNLETKKEDDSDRDIIGRAILADDDPLTLSIHQVIDSALGPQKYAEIKGSPRLQTPLKP